MTKEREEQKYDLRTLEHLMREGVVSQKDYVTYLKSLPDSASNADYVEVFEEPSSSDESVQSEGNLTFRPAEPTSSS